MNRREMLGATAGFVVGSGVVEAAANTPVPPFKIIDKRLNYKVVLSELQDGECGYIHGECIMLSKQDDMFYFATGNDCLTVSNECSEGYPFWVGKKGGNYYVAHDEKVFTQKMPQPPAVLAYNRAYPLDKKENDFFLVPIDWKECAKHKLVERNILLLVSAVAMMNQLRDLHGIYASLCSWDHDNHRLKAALEPVAHMGVLKSLGIK